MMSICSYILMYIDSFYLWKNSSVIPIIQLNLISSSRTVFLFSCLFSDLHTLCKSLSFYLMALIWFSEMWIPFSFSSVDFNFATMYLIFLPSSFTLFIFHFTRLFSLISPFSCWLLFYRISVFWHLSISKISKI